MEPLLRILFGLILSKGCKNRRTTSRRAHSNLFLLLQKLHLGPQGLRHYPAIVGCNTVQVSKPLSPAVLNLSTLIYYASLKQLNTNNTTLEARISLCDSLEQFYQNLCRVLLRISSNLYSVILFPVDPIASRLVHLEPVLDDGSS